MSTVNSYLQLLVGPQRRALMELLAYLSVVDGEVSFEEVIFIAEVSNQLGVDETAGELIDAVAEKGLDDVCACFDADQVKAIALAELVSIAWADGTYDASERDGVRAIGQAMSVSEETIVSLEGWVERGEAWESEGRRLLGGHGG